MVGVPLSRFYFMVHHIVIAHIAVLALLVIARRAASTIGTDRTLPSSSDSVDEIRRTSVAGLGWQEKGQISNVSSVNWTLGTREVRKEVRFMIPG